MNRLKRLGWSVVFADLPPRYHWGISPQQRTVYLQAGLSRGALRRAVRAVLAAVPG